MAEDSIEGAWAAGHEAGRARQALLSNPYPAGTPQARSWEAGWREAEGTGRPGDEAPVAETP